jgi:hypothetical protein
VATELIDHRLSKDRAFSGVMKNMEPDESRVQVAVYHHRFS